MPQLMPFMWVYSVFMGLVLLLMLVFVFNVVNIVSYFICEDINWKIYMMMW